MGKGKGYILPFSKEHLSVIELSFNEITLQPSVYTEMQQMRCIPVKELIANKRRWRNAPRRQNCNNFLFFSSLFLSFTLFYKVISHLKSKSKARHIFSPTTTPTPKSPPKLLIASSLINEGQNVEDKHSTADRKAQTEISAKVSGRMV